MKKLTIARQLRIQPDQHTSRDQKPSQTAGQSLLQKRRLSGSSQCSAQRSDDYFRQVLESLPANRSLGREFIRQEILKTFFKNTWGLCFCFVLLCFVLFCFVLFCFVLFCFVFVLYVVLEVGCWSRSKSVCIQKSFWHLVCMLRMPTDHYLGREFIRAIS